jgi:hypothetical protein
MYQLQRWSYVYCGANIRYSVAQMKLNFSKVVLKTNNDCNYKLERYYPGAWSNPIGKSEIALNPNRTLMAVIYNTMYYVDLRYY